MEDNKLIIHDATGVIGEIANVINPEIHEEINAGYTFSFNTVMDEKVTLLNYPNLIEVDGDYFQTSRIVKNRNSTVSVLVACDHVSYQLNRYPIQEDMEFDSSPDVIMNQLLAGTEFTVGTVEWLGSVEFKPSSTNVREALIELADHLHYELVWNKYTVSLVWRRGEDNDLEFTLGENLVGVTEEIDNSEGYPVYAYDVDVLDLAHLTEYAFLSTVNLGDTVRVLDPPLDIDVRLRVITYSRDPFQKVNPQVSIGNRIRDILDYFDDVDDQLDSIEETKVDNTIYINGSAILSAGMSSYTIWDGHWMEYGRGVEGTEFTFEFEQAYDEVKSVTNGIEGTLTTGDVAVAYELIKNSAGKYTGVKASVVGTDMTVESLSIQAVCWIDPTGGVIGG